MSTSAAIDLQSALLERLTRVHDQIERSARSTGRTASDITLVGVSKMVDRAAVDLAYACGLRDFGENRVQDARAKFAEDVPADLRLHLIGSLQTNKARHVVGSFHLVHSVDRDALVDALDARASQIGVTQSVLIQVNIAREEQKHGCIAEDTSGLIERVLDAPNLALKGLMTMAPLVSTIDEARPIFAELRALRDRLRDRYPEANLRHLSMGMTNDFPAAIEEGATIVRVGRAIFATPI
ncbi:MAG TPA: YggS family pyridoxal phosphate-dependent enzyme [Thermomicrobiales bacterium]|nr:YggS family pyridoxal phosphate-dependent enzyme [Thermomicrobiales bacterium]